MGEKKTLLKLRDLEEAFIQGYTNASSSLEALKKEAVCYQQFHSGLYQLENIADFNHSLLSSESDIVVTTEILGDVFGKSYLMISANEFESLTRGLPVADDPSVDFRMEFIKELDNILSASVITELANNLSIKAYGHIPILESSGSRSIGKVIQDDFSPHTDSVYLTAIYFAFQSEPAITPRFLWVVDRNEFGRHDE